MGVMAATRRSHVLIRPFPNPSVQSLSPHAKALAALDLRMAQSLADRATAGMTKAKDLFTRAMQERKVRLGPSALLQQSAMPHRTLSRILGTAQQAFAAA